MEDHGGAQKAEEADPGNITVCWKRLSVRVSGGAERLVCEPLTCCRVFVESNILVGVGGRLQALDEARGWLTEASISRLANSNTIIIIISVTIICDLLARFRASSVVPDAMCSPGYTSEIS